jgi:heat shock protein HslJ
MSSVVGAMRVAVALLVLGIAGCGGDDGTDAEPPSFVGVPWVLSSGIDVAGWERIAPSVVFKDETVGGSTGCNRFTASYTVDGDSLELGTIASTQMACPPPADDVERAYLAALDQVAGWGVDGDELVLLDDGGAELLRYRAASPIGEWEATAFLTGNAVKSLLPGTTITATFAEGGKLSGSSGCNRYTASFTTDRGRIEISPPASTRMHCAEPKGVMEQEAAYLAVLPSAVEYRVDGDSLALLTADGTYVASFARAPAR